MSMNTISAQPSSTDTSAVGAQRPSSESRLLPSESEKSAAIIGTISIHCSPMLARTKFSAIMTIFSATACRLEMFRTLRSCVSQTQSSVSTSITHHVPTMLAVMGMPPRIGISKYTGAP